MKNMNKTDDVQIKIMVKQIKSFYQAAKDCAYNLSKADFNKGDAWPCIIADGDIQLSLSSKGNKPDYDMHYSYIVNASFSLELQLKLLLLLETGGLDVGAKAGHGLLKLFEKLDVTTKENVRSSYLASVSINKIYYTGLFSDIKRYAPSGMHAVVDLQFHSALNFADGAFQKWRYSFEGNKGRTGLYSYSEMFFALDDEISRKLTT